MRGASHRPKHNSRVVKIFDFADGDRRAVFLIVALDGRFMGRTPIDGDFLRHAMTANCLGQEPLGSVLVSMLRQQEIDGLAGLIHSAIEVIPLAFDLDIGLVHPPADPHRALAAVERLLQRRTVL